MQCEERQIYPPLMGENMLTHLHRQAQFQLLPIQPLLEYNKQYQQLKMEQYQVLLKEITVILDPPQHLETFQVPSQAMQAVLHLSVQAQV